MPKVVVVFGAWCRRCGGVGENFVVVEVVAGVLVSEFVWGSRLG